MTPAGTATVATVPRRRPMLALGALLLLAFLLRLPGITDPPIEFHPLRQYHSALIARAWYAHVPGVDAVPRAAADAVSPGVVEPPVMEAVAVAGYVVTGGAHLWVGRIVAVICWLAGAVALFLVARRLAGLAGAFTATAVFLYLPFAIEASRSFQPDPLFVAATLWAVVALLRWDDDPTRRRLVVAAGIAGFAIFVKLMAVFFVVAVFLALAVRRRGVKAMLTDRDTYVFLAVAALPSAAYLGIGFGAGFLRGEQSARFAPKLWVDASYWRGWQAMVRQVVAAPFLVLAVLGLAVARGRALSVTVALFVAYGVYGLVFTWHIHTHSYYSLPLVPVVALAIGVLAQWVAGRASAKGATAAAVAVPVALVALVVLVAYGARVHRTQLRMPRADAVAVVDEAKAIGQRAGYPHRAIYLARYYGAALRYYGYVSGAEWPSASVLDEERILDGRVTPPAERLRSLRRESRARFFVLADPDAPAEQPELVRYLATHFERVARGDGYEVFDLRATKRA